LLAELSLCLVNVNFPREPRGLMWTRASVRRYDGHVVPTKDPLGRELFWFTVTPIEGADEGTDRWAMERGWVSMTPLQLNPTDEHQLGDLRGRHPLDEALAAVVSPTPSPEAEKSVREDEAGNTRTVLDGFPQASDVGVISTAARPDAARERAADRQDATVPHSK
jgi:hypothetical protein